MKKDLDFPWIGLEVRHRDGMRGHVLSPDKFRPGRFEIQFVDRVCATHDARSLFVDGESLDSWLGPIANSFENWQRAIQHPEQVKEWLAAKEEVRRVAQARDSLRHQVHALLDAANYDEADRLYQARCADWWEQLDYEAAKIGARFVHHFVETYHSGSLRELDALFQERHNTVDLSTEDFVALKLPKVRSHLADIELDEEQERANARPEARFLIKARAGSGKTRTLCARAALAICDEQLTANQVLILAFNKAAAAEVKHRVQKMGGIADYENARTFHSLAYQLVKPKKKFAL